MNSTDICANTFSAMAMPGADKHVADDKPVIRVKELCERDRRSLLMHFLALEDADRMLRFGSALPDELITKYVQKINFTRDAVFGVFDSKFNLVGVGHLAYVPRETLPIITRATLKDRTAEFGVSVTASSRGSRIGTKLFQRAEMHCRNADIDTLYMHCLTSNQVMMHIASKAGMTIQHEHGESDAFLKLNPANPGSMMCEAVAEQVATFDYAMKAHTHAAKKWLEIFPAFKIN